MSSVIQCHGCFHSGAGYSMSATLQMVVRQEYYSCRTADGVVDEWVKSVGKL